MKKITTLLVALAMVLLFATTAGATPSTYNSGFQVQNLSSGSAAAVTISFYALGNGTAALTVNDTIDAGGSNTYFPLDGTGGNPNLPAGFSGSAVISSDQPVAAIANLLGDGFNSGASYGSFSGGSESVSLPLVAKGQVNVYDTFFNVQNVGSGSADVTVTYAGTACTETATIPAGAAAKFDQATNTCLAAGHVGAATVAAGTGQEIVATVVETTRNNTGLFAYNGFVSASSTVVVPLVQFNNGGFHSGVQIQNVGDTNTTVTVEFVPAGGVGTACTESGTINAGASGTFGLFAFSLNGGSNTDDCTLGERFVGSATITNADSQNMVAIINQTNFTNFASAYNGFDPATATTTLSMPLLMDRNFGYFTGYNLQNVGTGEAAVTCTYSTASNGGTIATDNFTLAAGEAVNELQLNQASQTTYVGSANCTADQPIIAVVNELGAGTTVDLLFTYEAFNQ
jgi:hypothetical protein